MTERSGTLPMWIVYDHPRDFPDSFVARLWQTSARGVEATDTLIVSRDLDRIREKFAGNGLVRMMRDENDDPCIVEVWL